MDLLRTIAIIIIIIFLSVEVALYLLQTKLIFYPGHLPPNYKFRLRPGDEEVFINTSDGEKINALFYKGARQEVILYFHGNAGDLSGWQFVAEDFAALAFSVLLIDYRGYGKSSGSISEEGFYNDADAAYSFLIQKKGFTPDQVIIYGRSVGTGVATTLASKNKCRGLILESPYSSLGKLANEKLPFFFPSLYLKYKFNNLDKINDVKCPVVFIHGDKDELIPASHTETLYYKFTGRKKLLIVKGGSHNDLNDFEEHKIFLEEALTTFLN